MGQRWVKPEYMRKVNAHYERIDTRNGVKNGVSEVHQFGMRSDYAHYDRINLARSFSPCFEGQSVHNALLLCSSIRGYRRGGEDEAERAAEMSPQKVPCQSVPV